MLDEKIKLEEYFKEEIERVSGIEIKQIEEEVQQIRERSMQSMEIEVQRESEMEREQIFKEMLSDHAIALSKLHEEMNRKLMDERKKIAKKVFDEVYANLEAFTSSTKYKEYLIQKVQDLSQKHYGHVVFYVTKKDEPYLTDIKNAYGDCEGKVDPNMQIGGIRLECLEKGFVVDESFDTSMKEQSDWFYSYSGLFIK